MSAFTELQAPPGGRMWTCCAAFRRSRARQARQGRVWRPWRAPAGDAGDDLGRIPAPLVAIECGGQRRMHPGEARRREDPRGAAPARGAVMRQRRGPYRQPDVEPSAIPTKVFIGCHRHLHSARPGTEPCVPGSPAGGTTDPRRIGSTIPDYLKPTGLSRPERGGRPDPPARMPERRTAGQTCFPATPSAPGPARPAPPVTPRRTAVVVIAAAPARGVPIPWSTPPRSTSGRPPRRRPWRCPGSVP